MPWRALASTICQQKDVASVTAQRKKTTRALAHELGSSAPLQEGTLFCWMQNVLVVRMSGNI